MTIYLNKAQIDKIRPIIARTFPDYKGNSVSVNITDNKIGMISHWDGGYRDYFAVLDLTTMQAHHVRQSGTMFDKLPAEEATPSPTLLIVEYSIRGSAKSTLSLYVHPDTAKGMDLDAVPLFKLTTDEEIVLYFTRSHKNSYGGQTNCRLREALRVSTITSERAWQIAQASLQGKGLLNKTFAITPEGHTVASNLGLNLSDHLRKERVTA